MSVSIFNIITINLFHKETIRLLGETILLYKIIKIRFLSIFNKLKSMFLTNQEKKDMISIGKDAWIYSERLFAAFLTGKS